VGQSIPTSVTGSISETADSGTAGFVTLGALGRFISGLGWIIAVFCALLALVGIGSIMTDNRIPGVMSLYFAILGVISGIIMVAFGQLISCFVSIERNTRATLRIFQDRIKK